MSLKKIVGLTVLGLVLLVIVGGITLLILVRIRPGWYEYQELSPKEMLAAKEDMIRLAAKFNNAATEAESFVLALTDRQINDMVAVIVDRDRVLPDYLAHPQIRMSDDKILAGAMVSFKGQTSVFSIGIRPYVDSAGLLHIELGKPKAGAMRLPENFLPEKAQKPYAPQVWENYRDLIYPEPLKRWNKKGFGIHYSHDSAGTFESLDCIARFMYDNIPPKPKMIKTSGNVIDDLLNGNGHIHGLGFSENSSEIVDVFLRRNGYFPNRQS